MNFELLIDSKKVNETSSYSFRGVQLFDFELTFQNSIVKS